MEEDSRGGGGVTGSEEARKRGKEVRFDIFRETLTCFVIYNVRDKFSWMLYKRNSFSHRIILRELILMKRKQRILSYYL